MDYEKSFISDKKRLRSAEFVFKSVMPIKHLKYNNSDNFIFKLKLFRIHFSFDFAQCFGPFHKTSK